MRMNLLSTVAMSAIAAAVVWSGQVSADDARGGGSDHGQHDNDSHHGSSPQNQVRTATPIKHFVYMLQGDRSFDNYFGTYPGADGEMKGWKLDLLRAHEELVRRSNSSAVTWLGARLIVELPVSPPDV